MHQPQAADHEPVASIHGHHHQHGHGAPTDAARLSCSCSSDPLTLSTAEIAVIPGQPSLASPTLVEHVLPLRSQAASDVRLAPVAPPPKPSLA